MNELVKLCKFGLAIRINNHRRAYQTVEDYLNKLVGRTKISLYNLLTMIDTDTIIEIQAFPHNSNNPITVYHYDIDKAIDEMIAMLA